MTSNFKDESRPFKDISNDNRKEGAKSSGGQILDAFVYHNYSIADQPGSVRLGKQVVSWGESTFIGGGINSINPIDVSAFRRPGAEIKEGLIPVNMFYVSQSLTENLSAEAFYQLEWDQTVTDNCGTFFSQPDIISDGCDNNLRVLNKRSTIPAAALRPLAADWASTSTTKVYWCVAARIAMRVTAASGARPSSTCSNRWTPSSVPTS